MLKDSKNFTCSQFYRMFESGGPVLNPNTVLTGLLDDWPALRRWDYAYLRRHLGEKPVTVSVAEGMETLTATAQLGADSDSSHRAKAAGAASTQEPPR